MAPIFFVLHIVRLSRYLDCFYKMIFCSNSFGTTIAFPYTPLLILAQCLMWPLVCCVFVITIFLVCGSR
jgi:hypothetical protein